MCVRVSRALEFTWNHMGAAARLRSLSSPRYLLPSPALKATLVESAAEAAGRAAVRSQRWRSGEESGAAAPTTAGNMEDGASKLRIGGRVKETEEKDREAAVRERVEDEGSCHLR